MTHLASLLKAYRRDEGGAVAIIFVLMFLSTIGIAGLAVDTARYYHAATHVEATVDSVSLMSAKLLDSGDFSVADVREQGEAYFNAQLESLLEEKGATIVNFQLDASTSNKTIDVSVELQMPLTLLRAVGFDSIPLKRSSSASFQSRRIEVALVLDTTGSMCDPCDKMDALKSAAKQMIDALYNDDPRRGFVRVSLVPYGGAVNAGGYLGQLTDPPVNGNDGGDNETNDTSGSAYTTCIVERLGNAQFTDDAPVGVNKLRRGTEHGGERYACNLAELQPLTDLRSSSTRDTFKDKIDALTPSGWTPGHLGAAMGWYTLSPNWSSVWGAASRPNQYGRTDVVKSVVLMTDGMFNSANTGETSDISEDPTVVNSSGYQALELCSAMRNAGIMVYTVAFQAPSNAEELLETCAGGTENHYNVDTSNELIASFRDIAVKIQAIRLSN